MDIDLGTLRERVLLACGWLADTAMVKTDRVAPPVADPRGFRYASWKGAIRGEYSAARREWWFFCPVWHTGQAVKALLEASAAVPGAARFADAAREGVGFILNAQLWGPEEPDRGLILAYEDFPDKVNTSAVLECLDGLVAADRRGLVPGLAERIEAAGRFLLERTYLPGEGLFRDVYDPALHAPLLPNPYPSKTGQGRPLLDDGVFLTLHRMTKDPAFLAAHVETAERLVRDQRPAGNWLDYGPCDAKRGRFHPRHTYWWALPLVETWRATGRREFLDTALASGEFCRRAMRADGGWIRGLYADFNTDSFGHAASGSACAAILFTELAAATGDRRWLDDAARGLSFCMTMQMTAPEDPNLAGCVVEKVLPPDGTDRSPYHVRDLGTIFFVAAACRYLAAADGRAS